MILSSMTVSFHKILSQSGREHRDLQHNYIENELRLMNDMRMAREVQRQLLHREMLDVPGVDFAATCVPARELGGIHSGDKRTSCREDRNLEMHSLAHVSPYVFDAVAKCGQ